MKAIRVEQHGGPEVLQLQDVPDPTPSAGEVLLRVHAAGVNPVETYIRAGQHGYSASMPYTPGGDAAGVVEALGADVRGVAVGDRVFTSRAHTGAYAERALARADDVYPLPEHVSFAAGAAIGVPWATAYRAPLPARADPAGGDLARARRERRRRLGRGAARARGRRDRLRHRRHRRGASPRRRARRAPRPRPPRARTT